MRKLVVATRSPHKLREIQELLPALALIDLNEAGIPESPEEDKVEAFDTFEGNALAKALYFCGRTHMPVIADDSGLCVDALEGRPGVRSKRFSGRTDLRGVELDESNNARLLELLSNVPSRKRTAHYVCVIAVVTPEGEEATFRGSVDGTILTASRGSGGFGYDPLFFVEALGATFAEVDTAVKNRLSHRAEAVHAAAGYLEQL